MAYYAPADRLWLLAISHRSFPAKEVRFRLPHSAFRLYPNKHSMKNLILFLITVFLSVTALPPRWSTSPTPTSRRYRVGNPYQHQWRRGDTGGGGGGYEGAIRVPGLGITDLTGIEAFTNIDTLDCSENQLVA